jgi:quinoprotein glucose dehydrogenase
MSDDHPVPIEGIGAQANTPYASDPTTFLSPLDVPCTAPPYGTISAIDLRTHKLVWTKRFGTAEGSGPLGIASRLPFLMGTPNTGGAAITRGGLTFIAAAPDGYLRAYETVTGNEVWRSKLPVPAFATPMTYWSAKSNRQFVAVAASGSPGFFTATGDYIIAYALPAKP